MKKSKWLLGTAMSILLLAACDETTITTTNENGEEVQVRVEKMASVNYDDVRVVNNTNYSTDSGEYTYKDSEGKEFETNQMYAEYKYVESDKQKVQEFLLTYRLGTLTNVEEAPSEGYLLILGYDEREYHIAKNVTTSYGETDAELINGIKINTNDYYKSIKYTSKEQLLTEIKKVEEKVATLKEEFGMIEAATTTEEKVESKE